MRKTTVVGKSCPFCRSKQLVKAGFLYDKNGKQQRYKCNKCKRFTIKPRRG